MFRGGSIVVPVIQVMKNTQMMSSSTSRQSPENEQNAADDGNENLARFADADGAPSNSETLETENGVQIKKFDETAVGCGQADQLLSAGEETICKNETNGEKIVHLESIN